jgi:hypothetical protein
MQARRWDSNLGKNKDNEMEVSMEKKMEKEVKQK